MLGDVDNDYVLLMNACAVKGLSIFLALARAMPDIQIRRAARLGHNCCRADGAVGGLRNVTLLSNSQKSRRCFLSHSRRPYAFAVG